MTKPEEWAQFHLLLCQPQTALDFANQIKNPLLKEIFKSTIYSLMLISRPKVSSLQSPVPEVRESDIAYRTKLDLQEIWQDELDDLQINDFCSFPKATTSQAAAFESKSKDSFSKILSNSNNIPLPVLALASDLGLELNLDEKDITSRIQELPQAYGDRFLYLIKKKKQSAPEVSISGNSAKITGLSLRNIATSPHEMEIPWLLK